MKVKITKIDKAELPKYPTPDKKDYEAGQENYGVSIPIDYWIIGELSYPIEENKSIRALRTERNGVKCAGLFHTSKVIKLEGNIAETENSKYQIEYLED